MNFEKINTQESLRKATDEDIQKLDKALDHLVNSKAMTESIYDLRSVLSDLISESRKAGFEPEYTHPDAGPLPLNEDTIRVFDSLVSAASTAKDASELYQFSDAGLPPDVIRRVKELNNLQ